MSTTVRRVDGAKVRGFACLLVASATVALVAQQQGLDPKDILKPLSDSWPTYSGDYSARRYSALKQINQANVKNLSLAWTTAVTAGPGTVAVAPPFGPMPPAVIEGGVGDNEFVGATTIKGAVLAVNGVLYVTAPDNIWALDARTARQLWRYTYPANQGFHIGHRGAAIYKDTVYLTTPDAHLVALDARTGKVRWDVVIADAKRGFWSTNAPLLVRGHLLVGVAGDFDNLPGMLKSFDPETGQVQWTFYSTPPPGTPGSKSGGATGGQMWMTGTYDP
ncbi:MAG TPA: PQQ-binding-like beta-propeller repeat protein, partial [Vicinamibacterales bacterium]